MVRVAAPRCDSIKKAAGGSPAAGGLYGFALRQPHAQVCRAKIKPARKPDAKPWTAGIHARQTTKPAQNVKPAARRVARGAQDRFLRRLNRKEHSESWGDVSNRAGGSRRPGSTAGFPTGFKATWITARQGRKRVNSSMGCTPLKARFRLFLPGLDPPTGIPYYRATV